MYDEGEVDALRIELHNLQELYRNLDAQIKVIHERSDRVWRDGVYPLAEQVGTLFNSIDRLDNKDKSKPSKPVKRNKKYYQELCQEALSGWATAFNKLDGREFNGFEELVERFGSETYYSDTYDQYILPWDVKETISWSDDDFLEELEDNGWGKYI